MIVIADKASVYNPKKYPIPLVNRLEKHLLSVESILDDNMKIMVDDITLWCDSLAKLSAQFSGLKPSATSRQLTPSDIFIGYTEDSVPTLVFKKAREIKKARPGISDVEVYFNVNEAVKEYLMQCATSDGIIRLQLSSADSDFVKSDNIVSKYFKTQWHDNFGQFFQELIKDTASHGFVQITTHSRLLSQNDVKTMRSEDVVVRHESLVAFDTQQQFIQLLSDFYRPSPDSARSKNHVLIIQCDCGHLYEKRINCARYTIIDEHSKYMAEKSTELDAYEQFDADDNNETIKINFKIILIIQVPKTLGRCITGFQAAKWFCYHIDDLMDNLSIGNLFDYQDKSLSKLFAESVGTNAKYALTLHNILKSIVYVSCSKVNAKQTRSIQRVEIIIELLKKNSQLCDCLLKHIAKLQADREASLSSDEVARKWLFKEAAKLSNVVKYGTLKNSCVNLIEHRLGHLFAGLIAFIDTNSNLDLLVESSPGREWIPKLWLEMFNDEAITNFNYIQMYLQANNSSDKTEFACLDSTKSHSLKLPFSWLLKQFLDQLVLIKVKEVS